MSTILREGDTAQATVVQAEERDARELERRWERRETRRMRFLDARTRTIGQDLAALDAQIADKKRREAEERERERREAEDMMRAAAAADRYRAHMEAEKKRRARATLLSVKHQAMTRDLREDRDMVGSRSAELRGTRMMREKEDDERLGPASMQRFDGEDVLAGDRAMVQAAQRLRWAEEQAAEKAAAREEERKEEEAFARAQMEAARRAEEIRALQLAEKRSREREAMAENMRMAAERQEAANRKRGTDVSLDHAVGAAPPGLLDEDVRDGEADPWALGYGRRRVDHYRGMSREEQQQILFEQAAQAEAVKQRKLREKEEEQQWARERDEAVAAAARYEAALRREKEARAAALRAELRAEADLQARKRLEEKQYQEEPAFTQGGFFEGFGKSDR